MYTHCWKLISNSQLRLRATTRCGSITVPVAVSVVVFFAIVGGPQTLLSQNTAAKPNMRALLKTFNSEFIEITPGTGKFPATFLMGSKKSGVKNETPVHKVTIKHSFAIGKYEIPQNLYEAVMGKNPSRWKGPRNSVEMISWKDSVRFCELVTEHLRDAKILGSDEVIRLPNEAEWEYCCRAGTNTAFSFGDSATKTGKLGSKESVLDLYGWHTGNAAGNDPAVGALKPNPWGLYDMHGYLWEFVSDAYHSDYSTAPTDGSVAKALSLKSKTRGQRIMRSGSWEDPYQDLRSASRKPVSEAFKSPAVGFRCVKSKQ